MDNFYEVYNWLKGLTNPKSERQFFDYINTVDEPGRKSSFNKITTDAQLKILDSNFNTITTAKFLNIFPVSLSGVRFTADANDIDYVTADATFKYTLMEFINSDGKII